MRPSLPALALCALALPAALRAADVPLQSLPQVPSLDPAAMDRTADPCVDFYQYACGGWMKANPRPADKARWSVYGKVGQDNQSLLWGILEESAKPNPGRTAEQQKVGDYFAACMDEAAIEKAGSAPIQPYLARIAALGKKEQLAPLVGELHSGLAGRGTFFGFGSTQDAGDATAVIATATAGGLGLPDRDYYLADDERSKEIRQRYVAHVAALLQLLGDAPEKAQAAAQTVMAIEIELAKASLTRVERRDPKKTYHRMGFADLQKITPSFSWDAYLAAVGNPPKSAVDVSEPAFFAALETQLKDRPLDDWRSYLRYHVAESAAESLSRPFADESFAFYSRFLRGVEQQEPRWKRCVARVDRDLGEALGKVYVERTFTPEARQGAERMVRQIQEVMAERIAALDWMSPATKQEAQTKLRGMRNKIGYPKVWRDYSAVTITRGDYFADLLAVRAFENRRQLQKIGQPVDLDEWGMTPPTVNAYYNPAMNDMNFPAGILQPPLYDPRSDDAPNYGNTGATVGHELTHGFDDEGSQFDAKGNLRDWWTAADRAEFDRRAACVSDFFSRFVAVDDLHVNGKLTLGEDLADIGGTSLAYEAWQRQVAGQQLPNKDGLTPEQRFFVGNAQWACSNESDESKRLRVKTDPHSPPKFRVNGTFAHLPEFAAAFSCKAGQPMVAEKVCKVW